MESVALLLARGRMKGMTVELDGQDLTVTGPRTSEAFVADIRARKADVVAYLLELGCGAIHIRSERWIRSGGKAHCPRCGRFMGYVMSIDAVAMEGFE